jgi:hypothetical protein
MFIASTAKSRFKQFESLRARPIGGSLLAAWLAACLAPQSGASANASQALLNAIARADRAEIERVITDDVQLVYGERCPATKPCRNRNEFLAALPASGEIQVDANASPVLTGNVWRTAITVTRAGNVVKGGAEIYVRDGRIASLIVDAKTSATENRAAPGRRKFDWAGITATTNEDLGINSAEARARTLKTLRDGGVAVLCRHGNTNWAEQDVYGNAFTPEQRKDLRAQRKLSELGRAEGRAINAALKQHGVTVSAAFSTWWNRTNEFGALVAGVTPTVTADLGGAPTITGAVYQTMVNDAAKRPGITVLSAHAEPLGSMDVLRGASFREGDCVILKATSEKSFAVLTHLVPGQWAQLARP